MIEFPANSFAQFWQEWQDGPRTGSRLREFVVSITHEARVAAREEDCSRFSRLLKLYEAGSDLFPEDALRVAYDAGSVMLTELLAELNLYRSNVRVAISEVLGGLDLIHSIELRRHRLGLPRHRFSEKKVLLLGLLADCLMELEPTPELVLASTEIIQAYWPIAGTFLAGAREMYRADPERLREGLGTAACNGIGLAKLSVMLVPDSVQLCVEEFNRIAGEHLALETGHFRTNDVTGASAWYWDFELAKLRATGNASSTELKLCESNRLAAARLTFGFRSYQNLWRREREISVVRQRAASRETRVPRLASFPA